MATRSNIGAKQADGTIKAIYCHWDGYPEGVGALLAEHYTNPAKVEALLNLGGIPNLAPNIDSIETFASRGETDTEARIYANEAEWREEAGNSDIEFLYLFEETYTGQQTDIASDYSKEYAWSFFSIYDRWHLLQRATA